MLRAESRTATLATPGEPLSVTGEMITTTLSGAGVPSATTTRVFAAGAPATWTTTTPAGRRARTTLDALNRVTELAVVGSDPVTLAPLQFHYDERGRVDQVTHGTRVYTTSYDAAGWVAATTDPAGLGVSYAAGRHQRPAAVIELPGDRTLAMSYDLGGNLTALTAPSGSAHAFA